jgi:hypothetical protein
MPATPNTSVHRLEAFALQGCGRVSSPAAGPAATEERCPYDETHLPNDASPELADPDVDHHTDPHFEATRSKRSA